MVANNRPRFYKKKPVVIEAAHFVGTSSEIHALTFWLIENGYDWLVGDATNPESLRTRNQSQSDNTKPAKGIWIRPKDGMLMIRTLEGDMEAPYGHWIIKGVAGEFYACDPDIFEKSYELSE